MRIALVFRGDNVRRPEDCPHNNGRKYIDALMCWNNWKKTLIEDLLNNGHKCDVIFVTYESEILDKMKEIMNPKHVVVIPRISQYENGKHAIKFLHDHKSEYDRVLFTRFDFMYRIPITRWPKWNETGFFVVNKDVHWNGQKYYSGVFFLFDIEELNNFENALHYTQSNSPEHGIGKYFYINNLKFNIIYDEYYHILNNPLHALGSIEPEPDLDNPTSGEVALVN